MTGNFSALKIVVIEDEDYIRKLICRMLRQLGVQHVYEATEGGQGLLDVVRIRPDLVLCDIHMEPVNGLAFLEKLRGMPLPAVSNIPVVFLTADSNQTTVKQAKSLKINGYLVKPVSIASLQQRITSTVWRDSKTQG